MRIHPVHSLASTLDHHLLDFTNRLPGVQALWTGPGAVEDGVASVEAEGVLQFVEPFPGRLVTAVGEPTPSLEKHGRTEEAIPVPPVARAA